MLRWTPTASHRCGVYQRTATKTTCCCTCTLAVPSSGRYTLIERLLAPRKGGRSSSPAGRLPACTRTQVPRTNRGRRESVSLASRTRDSSPEHRQHRSLHWRKPCCEPGGYPSCEGGCSASCHSVGLALVRLGGEQPDTR